MEGLIAVSPTRLRGASLFIAALLLAGCASRFEPSENGGLPRLNAQNSVIAPGNGGELIPVTALEPGDILLTSVATLGSFGIRLGTFSPVSHAVLYLGDGQVAEAVGDGVRARRIDEVVAEEQMVVAFRHPGIDAEHAQRLRGFAMVQLGASRNDQFFCSQFVLEAYNQAGLPVTTADPRWVSPADLLHMREGDVPSIPATQPLRYVGHLKYNPPPVILVDGATAR